MLVGYEGFPELRSWEKVGYLEPRGWAQPGTQAAGLQAWLLLRCWLASPWGLTPGLRSAPFCVLESWSSMPKPTENTPGWALVSLAGSNPHAGSWAELS